MSALGKLETAVLFMRQIAHVDETIYARLSLKSGAYEIVAEQEGKKRPLISAKDEKEAEIIMNAMAAACALHTRKLMIEERKNER